MRLQKIFVLAWLCLGMGNAACCQEKPHGLWSRQVEEDVRAWMDEGDIPGLSLVILKDHQKVIKTFGYADRERQKPVTPRTLFEIGSCSKSFTALTVAQLLHQRNIELDASVARYIAWFRVSYKGKPQTITIRHLLHHTSGIPWSTLAKIPPSAAPDALEQTVRQLIGQELRKPPGKAYEYATINYDVLALVIQYCTGRPFETYLQENLINKLQLSSTTVGRPADAALMARGYKAGFFRAWPYDAPVYRGNYAAGYVISNAEDMARWLELQAGLVPTDLAGLIGFTHRRDESVPLHGMSAYAKGWEVALDGSGEIYHGGLNPNFSAYVTFRPATGMGVVVLANANSNYTRMIGNKIMKRLANEIIERELDPGDGNDKAYAGISLMVAVYVLVVVAMAGKLLAEVAGGKRGYQRLDRRKAANLARGLVLLLPFLYGLYILPGAIAGFSWASILVWSPFSFGVMMGVVVAAIAVSYLAYALSLFFPDPNEYKRQIPFILLMSILSGLANVVIIIMVTSLIGTEADLRYILFFYGLAFGLYLLGRRLVQVGLVRLTRGLVYDLRARLIGRVFSTSYQHFEKMDRGRIYNTLSDDVNTIGHAASVFILLITNVITASGAFLYLASQAFWATMLTVMLICTLSVIYYFVSRSTTVFYEKAHDEQNVFLRLVGGMIDGFKELSLHRNKRMEYKEDVLSSANAYRQKISVAEIRFIDAFLVGESLLVVVLGVVAFGIPELYPNIPYYAVVGFVIVLLYLIGPINTILNSIPVVMRLKVSWNQINKFIDQVPGNPDLEAAPPQTAVQVESLQVAGVRFSYQKEGEQDAFAIGPIDLEIKRGEIVFIIGGNGSGKTTFAKLVTGLYEPSEGHLLINGQPVRGGQLSEHISAVFSPAYLFEKLYNVDARLKTGEVKKYLHVLNLQHKVEIADNRYSTINLSGGQKKRLALLQCYLEDSPVYLFDEWAADQDPDYRNFFYRTLLPEMRSLNKIVIAITHDDHYFDVADRVFKMNQGKLEEYNEELYVKPTTLTE